jgi:hypothetical protein
MVESYETLYAQAVEQGGSNFKVPFNQIGNTASVFTPNDTAIVTPNSDARYSFGRQWRPLLVALQLLYFSCQPRAHL